MKKVFSILLVSCLTILLGCNGDSGEDTLANSPDIEGTDVNNSTGTQNTTKGTLGSIEFISAEPENIYLQGTGRQETSSVTFLVKNTYGEPLANMPVRFHLNTNNKGFGTYLPNGDVEDTGITNEQGLVSTVVSSGHVPTVINITASAENDDKTIQAESNQLTANTGLPHQSGFTIAATVLNPEASYIGTQSQITAWLSDNFNNPVADGTVVNFTAEGGTIEPSCKTANGTCQVMWTATEPYPADLRATILATATGHETFYDFNGDNIFDTSDGDAIQPTADLECNNELFSLYAGFGRLAPRASGFIDMPEAWRDDNENCRWDNTETVYFDQDGQIDTNPSPADGKFNGPQCKKGDPACALLNTTILRKALVLVMSSSVADYALINKNDGTIYQRSDGRTTTEPNNFAPIADGGKLNLQFAFAGMASTGQTVQPLPAESTVTVTASGGELTGVTSYTVPNWVPNINTAGYNTMDFTITNPAGGVAEDITLTVVIETPKSKKTSFSRTISLL